LPKDPIEIEKIGTKQNHLDKPITYDYPNQKQV
jgi:hypothetical protein